MPKKKTNSARSSKSSSAKTVTQKKKGVTAADEKEKQNIEMTKDSFWFKRKGHGYGFTPVSWQGWAVIVLYALVVLALTIPFADKGSCSNDLTKFVIFYLGVMSSTGLLLFVTFRMSPESRSRK